MYVFQKKTEFHRNILMNAGIWWYRTIGHILLATDSAHSTRSSQIPDKWYNDQLNYIKSPWLTTYLHPFLDGYSLFIPYLSHDIPLSWARLRRKIVAIPSHIPRRCHSKLPQISPRQRSKHWCSCLGMGGLVEFLYIYIFNQCGKPNHKAPPFFIIRAW